MSLSRLLASCAALAMLPLSQALAADYDPPIFIEEAPEYVPVEIGSGWYLRGDVSYNINREFEDDVFGVDPDFNFSEYTVPVSATIGMGYHLSDFFRVEANVGLLSRHTAEVNYLTADSSVEQSLENEIWSGIISAYGDLGTIAGFTPYVGAGVGLVSAKRDFRLSEDFDDLATTDTSFRDNERDYSLAYSLGAGVAYQVTDNLSLDVGYQYVAAPSAEYVEFTGPGTYAVRDGLDFHQVKVGLRYDLW